MIPPQVMDNKTIRVNNLMVGQQGNAAFKRLTSSLSTKELKILRKHPDLIERVSAISKMNVRELEAELKEEFSLEVEPSSNGDCWISTDALDPYVPEWAKTGHCGWYMGFDDTSLLGADFEDWAQNFLLQEVRMNIWLRYMEHKKSGKSGGGILGWGMYL